ncbi:hypothetical protein AY606_13025 [Acinetobacter sp. SFB]|uniref:hypothetical protein n=1 Tax=Acinetobacter sp. SFB TaxID=1805634 RepID=UPI0007D82198|nr:hypothetical protein [Acinetobacter sp. SFB]OAL76232.1 hypothetical protein AY606_13025 [Acinetobacter sp. SFB]
MEKTRINKRDDIDVQRVVLWYSYIEHCLRKTVPSEIARVIEPHKIRVHEGYIIDNDRKWRNYKKGLNVPNPKLIEKAESIVPGSSMMINHILWQTMRDSMPIDVLLQERVGRLSWKVQRLLYVHNKYDESKKLVSSLSKKKLMQLERLAGLDALAAQIIFLRVGIVQNENVLNIFRSIYRTLLIICTEIPFFYHCESLIVLMNSYVFSLIEPRSAILDKRVEDFTRNVKTLINLLLAMEDAGLVGFTRKEGIRLLSDFLSDSKVLNLFGESNPLVK